MLDLLGNIHFLYGMFDKNIFSLSNKLHYYD